MVCWPSGTADQVLREYQDPSLDFSSLHIGFIFSFVADYISLRGGILGKGLAQLRSSFRPWNHHLWPEAGVTWEQGCSFPVCRRQGRTASEGRAVAELATPQIGP